MIVFDVIKDLCFNDFSTIIIELSMFSDWLQVERNMKYIKFNHKNLDARCACTIPVKALIIANLCFDVLSRKTFLLKSILLPSEMHKLPAYQVNIICVAATYYIPFMYGIKYH